MEKQRSEASRIENTEPLMYREPSLVSILPYSLQTSYSVLAHMSRTVAALTGRTRGLQTPCGNGEGCEQKQPEDAWRRGVTFKLERRYGSTCRPPLYL